jgi:hypothetical protein
MHLIQFTLLHLDLIYCKLQDLDSYFHLLFYQLLKILPSKRWLLTQNFKKQLLMNCSILDQSLYFEFSTQNYSEFRTNSMQIEHTLKKLLQREFQLTTVFVTVFINIFLSNWCCLLLFSFSFICFINFISFKL